MLYSIIKYTVWRLVLYSIIKYTVWRPVLYSIKYGDHVMKTVLYTMKYSIQFEERVMHYEDLSIIQYGHMHYTVGRQYYSVWPHALYSMDTVLFSMATCIIQ